MTTGYRQSSAYRKIAAGDILESDYERLLEQQATALFPGLAFRWFKSDVTAGHVTKRPDFALIDRHYRGWWVVEAELSCHSLSHHVEPQIQVFSAADYGPEHLDTLSGTDGDLDPTRVSDMLMGLPPTVQVLVHGDHGTTSAWRETLAMYGAKVEHIDVYRSEKNDHLLIADGDLPAASDLNPLSTGLKCIRSQVLPKFIQVENPGPLSIQNGDDVEIEINSSISSWTRHDMGQKATLIPKAGDPLYDEDVPHHFRLMEKSATLLKVHNLS